MKNAPLAQLVEQQTLNLMVGGSIPLWRTITIIKINLNIEKNIRFIFLFLNTNYVNFKKG